MSTACAYLATFVPTPDVGRFNVVAQRIGGPAESLKSLAKTLTDEGHVGFIILAPNSAVAKQHADGFVQSNKLPYGVRDLT